MRELPKIPGYEITGLLGSGGMATVWKACQHSLGRFVAIKVLNPHLAVHEEELLQFREEVRLAARLSHPEIIRVYDARFSDDVSYVVMELVDGYTAGQWMRRKGRIDAGDALTIGLTVANALGYAWQHHKLVHCDVKPDNVMIHSDGTVKVADLGLARTFSAVREQNSAEEWALEVVGTPAYMSPEQVQGFEDLDCRTDIYSLGASLYHILTGRLPFEDTADKTLVHQLNNHTQPLHDRVGLDTADMRGLELLLAKMLAKNRGLRYHDWRLVSADIHHVLDGKIPSGPYLAPSETTLGYRPDTATFIRKFTSPRGGSFYNCHP